LRKKDPNGREVKARRKKRHGLESNCQEERKSNLPKKGHFKQTKKGQRKCNRGQRDGNHAVSPVPRGRKEGTSGTSQKKKQNERSSIRKKTISRTLRKEWERTQQKFRTHSAKKRGEHTCPHSA